MDSRSSPLLLPSLLNPGKNTLVEFSLTRIALVNLITVFSPSATLLITGLSRTPGMLTGVRMVTSDSKREPDFPTLADFAMTHHIPLFEDFLITLITKALLT